MLRIALADRVQGFAGNMASPVRKLVADWSTVPLRLLGDSQPAVYHFPTFPPMGRLNPRVLWTLHDLTWWLYRESASSLGRSYYPIIAKPALKRCSIVTDTHTIRDEIVDRLGVPPERTYVVYPGATNLPPASPAVRNKPYILTVGTLEPRKNLLNLVKAFNASAIASDFELIIVGRIGWGTIPEGVTVLSGVDDKALSSLYEGATAFVFASLYEGFGLPLVEAASRGVPIACSDIPVFHEVLVACNSEATYFEPTDIDSISAALSTAVSLAKNTIEKTGLIARGWDVTANEMAQIYQKLLAVD